MNRPKISWVYNRTGKWPAIVKGKVEERVPWSGVFILTCKEEEIPTRTSTRIDFAEQATINMPKRRAKQQVNGRESC